jgi:hypothetical protein
MQEEDLLATSLSMGSVQLREEVKKLKLSKVA